MTLKKFYLKLLNYLPFFPLTSHSTILHSSQYFRIPDTPVLNSPNSRMHTKLKISKERVRSLMDLDMPAEYSPDVEVPLPSELKDADRGVVVEPYFESGQDDWAMHGKVLQKAMTGVENEGDANELFEVGGDGELLDVERLLLEGAFDIPGDDENETDGDGDGDVSEFQDGSWSDKGLSAGAGGGVLYTMGGNGPFAGELGDYENLLSRKKGARTLELQPLQIKESFLGQAKPRSLKEGGLNPNSSNNPTERKKKGNRGQGQIIKEGENSALSGRRTSNSRNKKSKVSGGSSSVKSNSNSKPREAKDMGRTKPQIR